MKAKKGASMSLAQYLEDKNPEMVKIARGIQKLVKSVEPSAKQTMNSWNVPTLEIAGGYFCMFMVAKSHVSFGFPMATALPDPHGLLEGTGKNMRHVKLKKIEDLKQDGLKELIAAAVKMPAAPMRPK